MTSIGNYFPGIAMDEFIISVVTLTEIFYDYVCKLSMDGQFRGVGMDAAYAPAYIFK